MQAGFKAQAFLESLLRKVRQYLKIKVRLRDPLDDNAVHLIPSSRIITSRGHQNPITSARGLNSLIRC